MDTLIVINGQNLKAGANLAEVRRLVKILNLKLVKAYTFKMRFNMRRVLKFEAQGKMYSVAGPKRYIDYNAYSQDSLYFGFDKATAYQFKNGEVHEFDANSINFVQPHLIKKFSL